MVSQGKNTNFVEIRSLLNKHQNYKSNRGHRMRRRALVIILAILVMLLAIAGAACESGGGNDGTSTSTEKDAGSSTTDITNKSDIATKIADDEADWINVLDSETEELIANSASGPDLSAWKEIRLGTGRENDISTFDPLFSSRRTIKESNYIFRGKVLDCKEYRVTWPKEEDMWTLYISILKVEVLEVYLGDSFKQGDVIKVECADPFKEILSVFPQITKQGNSGEFIFLSTALDKEYLQEIVAMEWSGWTWEGKYADVLILSTFQNTFPVKDKIVFPYRDFFSCDKDVLDKTVSDDYSLALNKDDFDLAFKKLIENPDELPDADELMECRIPIERPEPTLEELRKQLEDAPEGSLDHSLLEWEIYLMERELGLRE